MGVGVAGTSVGAGGVVGSAGGVVGSAGAGGVAGTRALRRRARLVAPVGVNEQT